jgi:Na+/H+-dicarboxylate symporter/uncharacterized short protein YbdD (DUF466 family)
MTVKEGKKVRLSLSAKILIGLILGIVLGLFFGEAVGFLKIIGDAFIKLLQMSVLPYIVVSLIVGIGRLTYDVALSLAKKCGVVLLALWALTIAMVLVMPVAFPDWKTASYFSSSLVMEQEPFNFLELFIPSNPFFSLTNNIVPSVVVFSVALGVALMGLEKKDALIDSLSIVMDALTKITAFVVNLAPIGVFAITASAAGTMDVADLGRWQVYLVTYLAAWIVLSFWILPVLVSTLTPLTYRDVVLSTRDALVTAFATGNLLIVLPILAERSKTILEKYELEGKDSDSSPVDVIVPISFTFPNAGKLLTMSFLLFAGWFSGFSVSLDRYPEFVVVGFLSFFGLVAAAMPYLLSFLHIPQDMFQLFLISDVFIGRFGTLLAAMHVLILALLGSFALSGRLTIRWKRLINYAVVSVILTGLCLGAVRLLFTYAFEPTYTKYKTFVESELLTSPVKAKVYRSTSELPVSEIPHTARLGVVRERGSLRVGYFKDSLPFAFQNAAGTMVGFDIEMAHILAKELKVDLEFVLIKREEMKEQLEAGYCDIVMSGVAISTGRAQKVTFTEPYMDVTMAFAAKDHLINKFSRWESIQSREDLKIGVPNLPYYVSLAREKLPDAEVIPMNTQREFFRSERHEIDAMATTAESGSAWTLIYPEYSVVVPLPDPIHIPLSYAVQMGNVDVKNFIDTWIDLKKKDGTIKTLYEYWILGESARKKEPRWSVMRNVLHWVD